MNELNAILLCLQPYLDKTSHTHLSIIAKALLSMVGRVTMIGMSRWAEKGGSYSSIQRFFKKDIPWLSLNWEIAQTMVSDLDDVILMGGDITIATKSGKKTYGLGKFFSSIYSKVLPSLAFQTVSLISTKYKKSFPINVEQVLPKKKTDKPKKKKKRGRAKGSKNINRRDVKLNAELTQIQAMIRNVLNCIDNLITIAYFVYDGAYGNNAAVQMTRQVGLHLISKLRFDSALYYKWDGKYSGRGRPRIYGGKINYQKIKKKYLKSEKIKDGIHTKIYQILMRHKKFADTLNVVIIHKTNIKTDAHSHIILFSTDLELSWDKIKSYYCLRFQIEFNFRDAKQHWGLEDFMVIKKLAVYNAANLSLWMVNLSQRIMHLSGEKSIINLKARYHGLKYAQELFKTLPQIADVININEVLDQIPILGLINENKKAA